MRIFIGLLIAWANVSFSQVPNECMHIVSKYNGMIQKKPAAAVAYNQAKAQELSNCSASYNLRINAQREREAESRSRANVINAETSNQEAINQAKRADEQDLNQIRAARIEESKKICFSSWVNTFLKLLLPFSANKGVAIINNKTRIFFIT